LFVLGYGLVIAVTLPSRSEAAPGRFEDPAQSTNADEFLAVVEKESFQESEEQLLKGSDMQFLRSGFFAGGVPNPQTDLENMLGNRRAVKVLNHIQKLSSSEGTAACRDLFAKAFQVHTNLLAVWVRKQVDPKLQTASSVRDSKLTLLLAMFATADGGHRELLASQFTQLDRFEEDAKHAFTTLPPEAKDSLTSYFPLMFPPDNRSQVNLLMLVAARATNQTLNLLSQIDQLCEQASMRKMGVQIFSWDAPTVFSRTLWEGGGLATTKDRIIYPFYEWTGVMTTDSERPAQEALIKKSRSIALP
jgi:hypothetical protein